MNAASTSSTDYGTAAAATAVTVTIAASQSLHSIHSITWSYSGTPTGGALTIACDGTTYFSVDITQGGPGFKDFNPALLIPVYNKAITVTLASGAGAIVGKLHVHHTAQ